MKPSTIGVLLNLGESFTSLGSQAELMISQNIAAFSKAFRKVYVFTYSQESVRLPQNCVLVTPPFSIHRYFYAILLPLIHRRLIYRCDLLRCFQLSGTVPALVAKLLYGSKFIFNYGYDYAAFARIEAKPVRAQLFSWLSPIAVKFADAVIVKNKNLNISGHYLPNGVDLKTFKPKTNYRLSSPPQILYVGRLEPQKNLLTLLQAITQLKTEPEIIFIGQGNQRLKLINQAKALKLHLTIKPGIKHQALPRIYRSADIFVLPSLIEGSPKVLLEAMASGLPCIASDIPEHQHIITSGATGLLIQSTPSSLARGLDDLLRSLPLRRRLGQLSRRHIEANFDIKSIMVQEIKLLKSI